MSDLDLDAAVLLVRQRMELITHGSTHREPAIVAALAALNLAGELLGREQAGGMEAGALDVLSKRIEDHLIHKEAGGV
jgi:hypothetical protein